MAVQGAELLRGGDTVTAVAYAVITLLLGALATLAGVALGSRASAARASAERAEGRR